MFNFDVKHVILLILNAGNKNMKSNTTKKSSLFSQIKCVCPLNSMHVLKIWKLQKPVVSSEYEPDGGSDSCDFYDIRQWAKLLFIPNVSAFHANSWLTLKGVFADAVGIPRDILIVISIFATLSLKGESLSNGKQ